MEGPTYARRGASRAASSASRSSDLDFRTSKNQAGEVWSILAFTSLATLKDEVWPASLRRLDQCSLRAQGALRQGGSNESNAP